MKSISDLYQFARVKKTDMLIYSHLFLSLLYLASLLVLPRIGEYLKYSEFVLPFLFLTTIFYAPLVRKLFGSKVLIFFALFWIVVIISGLLSGLFLDTQVVYLIALPVRYIEILTPLFSFAIATYYKPKIVFGFFKYLTLLLVAYVGINFFLRFQSGFYGLAVLPGETGSGQVGISFGLLATYFLWLFLFQNDLSVSRVAKDSSSKGALILFFLSFFTVILNVQRSSIGAVLAVVFVSIFISIFIRYKSVIVQNFKVVGYFFFASIGLFILLESLSGEIVETLFRVAARFSTIDASSSYRFSRWVIFFNLDVWSYVTSVFGVGFGAHNFFYGPGDFTPRFDNLFLRLLFETGLLGLFFFISAHVLIIWRTYSKSRKAGSLALYITVFMFVMCLTFEALFVYVPGSLYYSLLGVSVGLSFHLSKSPQINIEKSF